MYVNENLGESTMSEETPPEASLIADPEQPELEPNADKLIYTEGDMVVISKLLLSNVLVGLLFFLIGGGAGIYLGANVFAPEPEQVVIQQQQPQQPAAPAARLDNVSVDDDPGLGSEDAPVTIVEFSDFRCGFCRRFHEETYKQIIEDYGDQIYFVYRDFPVVGGQASAEAANCAYEQDLFWEFHDALFTVNINQTDAEFIALAEELGADTNQFGNCLEDGEYTDEVNNDLADGRSYGVTGTPTFFINGVRLVGAQPYESFKTIIDQELEAGG